MATYYIKTTGSGSGAGTDGDPWTIQQFVDSKESTLAADDEINISGGTHALTSQWSLSKDGIRYYGDPDNRPVIQWQNAVASFVKQTAYNDRYFDSIIFDSNGYEASSSAPFVSWQDEAFSRCKFITTGTTNIPQFGLNVVFYKCEWNGGSRVHGGTQILCSVTGTAGTTGAFYQSVVEKCIAFNCATGFANSGGASVAGSIAFGNTLDYTNNSGSHRKSMTDSIVGEIGGFHVNKLMMLNCFYQTLTTAPAFNSNPTVLAADPFVNAAAGDFRFTAAAKATAYYDDLKPILIGLQGVPAVTLDTDLVSGDSSPLIQSGGRFGVYES